MKADGGRADAAGSRASRRAALSRALVALLEQTPRHGYELFDHLRSLGLDVGSRWSVYRELRVLEQLEVVSSQLDVSTPGPARRVYALTRVGHAARHTTGPNAPSGSDDRS